MLTKEQAIERLHQFCKGFDRKLDAATALGIKPANLSEMLHGNRPFTAAVQDALGVELVKVVMYRIKEKTDAMDS